jgi:ABC-type uncharacterized transport system substrate-binding protein
LTVVLLFILLNSNLYAASTDILILKSGPERVYADIVKFVTNDLNARCGRQTDSCSLPPIKITSLQESGGEDGARLLTEPWRLIITVGGKAAAKVAEQDLSSPVLHTVLPQKSFEYIYRNDSDNVSAIIIDQPLTRKLALIRESMPERDRIGILITENSEIDKQTIQNAASRFDLTIRFGTVEDQQQIGNALRELLKDSDVLLALPDPSIFNRQTVKNILLSSYHNRVPVVGFSLGYVKAGAIAAVYSSPQDIGKHIGDWVTDFLNKRDKVPPTLAFPRYYSVSTNDNVADSLNIQLPTASTLESKLEERGP